jgi:hypothetical protein
MRGITLVPSVKLNAEVKMISTSISLPIIKDPHVLDTSILVTDTTSKKKIF